MDLENKKRIVASAIAGAAAAASPTALAQNITGNRYDHSAPVVAIEDIMLWKLRDEKATDDKSVRYRQELADCRKSGGAQAKAAGAGASGAKSAGDKKDGKYMGMGPADLQKAGIEVSKMPEGTPEQRAAKEEEQRQLNEATQAMVAQMMANQKPMTMVPTVPVPGGKRGAAITQSTTQAIQDANNPAVAACLSEVAAKYEDKSTPMQIVYQDQGFIEAEKLLKNGARTAHVTLTDGSRYNVVRKTGVYGLRAISLEDAMKAAALSRATVPEYEGQESTKPGSSVRSQAEQLLDAARRAAEAAKGR